MNRIIVTNPSKQHTPHLIYALNLIHNGSVIWLTSIRFNPPIFLKKWSFIQQRRFSHISKNQVLVPWYWIFREVILRVLFFGESRNFLRDQLHDFWVSKRIEKEKPAIIIGSEKSCRLSFQKAKQYNGLCILDLAQIHVHSLSKIRDKDLFLKKEWGNDYWFNKIRKTKLQEYELADFIFVISLKMKASLLLAGIDSKKILSLTLGFNPRIFHPHYFIPKNHLNHLNLVFVGNLSDSKGISFLIKMMCKLIHLPISLQLIGANAKVFKKNNPPVNISFLGIMDEEYVADHLRNADVFIFPSYQDSWGRVVVEAMACGLPVIVSNEVGASELMDDEVGFVLPIEENLWINTIIFLLLNPQHRKNMGSHAAAKMLSFSWNNYQIGLKKHIDNLFNAYYLIDDTKP